MDERDRARIRALLDHQNDGNGAAWKRAEGGINFLMVAVSSFRSGGGLLCREFSATSQHSDLTIAVARCSACRQLIGDWLVHK